MDCNLYLGRVWSCIFVLDLDRWVSMCCIFYPSVARCGEGQGRPFDHQWHVWWHRRSEVGLHQALRLPGEECRCCGIFVVRVQFVDILDRYLNLTLMPPKCGCMYTNGKISTEIFVYVMLHLCVYILHVWHVFYDRKVYRWKHPQLWTQTSPASS